MSFSLPGFNLFYLSRDNLEPEKYELITRPSVTWDYIRKEYEFDDRYRDHYHVEGLRPRPSYSRSYAYQNNHTNGVNTERRLRYLVFRGAIVMLNRYGSPGELFYIDNVGHLICKNYWAFEMNGAEQILKEYRNSVGCRYYSSGKPRPTSFLLPFSGGVPAPASEQTYQTINSKAAGRLLAAGGVYNGNVEGFRKAAEQLGGGAVKGYDQVLNEQTEGALIAASTILLGAKKAPFRFGSHRPERSLPRDKFGNPIPDTNIPHTQLGTKSGRKGDYTQAREWGYDAHNQLVPKRDIDFTDHGRPGNHPNPHQHDYIMNPTGGTFQHGPAKELEMP